MLTEGVTGSRFKLGAWLVAEDRGAAFDGSREVENPHRERTQIVVPLVTFDMRLTERFGVQAAATIPDSFRYAMDSARRSQANRNQIATATNGPHGADPDNRDHVMYGSRTQGSRRRVRDTHVAP